MRSWRSIRWMMVVAAVAAVVACGGEDPVADLQAACAELQTTGGVEGSPTLVRGRDGWLFQRGQLRHLETGRFWGPAAAESNQKAPPEFADPMPAILDFDRQLEERGIELVFVAVPTRPEIYPQGVLGAEAAADLDPVPRLHPPLAEFLTELEAAGVEVVDLVPPLLAHRDDPDGPVFRRTDPHMTPYAVELVARLLAERIRERPWFAGVEQHDLVERREVVDHLGPYANQLRKATGETLDTVPVATRAVSELTPEGERPLPARSPSSPVLVLGDSNTRWWHKRSSSLYEQLSYELGFPVDLVMTSGGGANDARLELVREARADPATLDRLRVVVWVLSALPLTNESDGWRPMPLP